MSSFLSKVPTSAIIHIVGYSALFFAPEIKRQFKTWSESRETKSNTVSVTDNDAQELTNAPHAQRIQNLDDTPVMAGHYAYHFEDVKKTQILKQAVMALSALHKLNNRRVLCLEYPRRGSSAVEIGSPKAAMSPLVLDAFIDCLVLPYFSACLAGVRVVPRTVPSCTLLLEDQKPSFLSVSHGLLKSIEIVDKVLPIFATVSVSRTVLALPWREPKLLTNHAEWEPVFTKALLTEASLSPFATSEVIREVVVPASSLAGCGIKPQHAATEKPLLLLEASKPERPALAIEIPRQDEITDSDKSSDSGSSAQDTSSKTTRSSSSPAGHADLSHVFNTNFKGSWADECEEAEWFVSQPTASPSDSEESEPTTPQDEGCVVPAKHNWFNSQTIAMFGDEDDELEMLIQQNKAGYTGEIPSPLIVAQTGDEELPVEEEDLAIDEPVLESHPIFPAIRPFGVAETGQFVKHVSSPEEKHDAEACLKEAYKHRHQHVEDRPFFPGAHQEEEKVEERPKMPEPSWANFNPRTTDFELNEWVHRMRFEAHPNYFSEDISHGTYRKHVGFRNAYRRHALPDDEGIPLPAGAYGFKVEPEVAWTRRGVKGFKEFFVWENGQPFYVDGGRSFFCSWWVPMGAPAYACVRWERDSLSHQIQYGHSSMHVAQSAEEIEEEAPAEDDASVSEDAAHRMLQYRVERCISRLGHRDDNEMEASVASELPFSILPAEITVVEAENEYFYGSDWPSDSNAPTAHPPPTPMMEPPTPSLAPVAASSGGLYGSPIYQGEIQPFSTIDGGAGLDNASRLETFFALLRP